MSIFGSIMHKIFHPGGAPAAAGPAGSPAAGASALAPVATGGGASR